MTDENPDRGTDAEHPLDALAREHNDPDLFPAEVRSLYDAGKARKARKVLLQHAKRESDPTRSAQQEALAEHSRLWLDPVAKPPTMYTVNGIGTKLYGQSQPAADGTHIATLWIVLLFIPIWPLGSYLVAPAEGRGWYFLAKAPFSPLALGVRRFALVVLIAAVFRITWGVYWSGSHADLVVYNGFARPVLVTVADRNENVRSQAHVVFEDLPLEPVTISTQWPGEASPFETLSYDFSRHGDYRLVYNVANRAALRLDYILYGDGTPPDGRWLDEGPVHVVPERIDYLFVEPPESTRVSEGSTLRKSVLYDPTADVPAIDAVQMLIRNARPDLALLVARAALRADPRNVSLAGVTAYSLLADDFSAQVGLFHDLIDRAPDAVDLHRYYQEVWPDDRKGEVKAEYATLLEQHADEAMYHYLAGRLEDIGSQAAVAHYNRALELEPDYAPVVRALAYQAEQARDWATAYRRYARYAAVDSAGGIDVQDVRMRIGHRLGRPTSEILALVTIDSADNAAYYERRLIAHLRIADDPSSWTQEADELFQYVVAGLGIDPPPAMRSNLQADGAITAGELGEARMLLGQIDPEDRAADIALRLVLSEGSTREDRQLLLDIPGWYDELNAGNKLPGMALLSQEARADARDQVDPSTREIVDLLQSPELLTDQNRLVEATQDLATSVRLAAYLAAARSLQSAATAERSRRFYLAEAYAMALPGELPYRRR